MELNKGISNPHLYLFTVCNLLTETASCGIECCIGDTVTYVSAYNDDMILRGSFGDCHAKDS